MTPDELPELAQFCAQAEPEPRRRQFEALYGEILNLVRLIMIPAAGSR